MTEAIDIVKHVCIGNGDKGIVFLHGWGGSKESLMSLAVKMPSQYKCILVDFYGFGQQSEPTVPYKLSDYVKSIKEIIDAYYLHDVTLVGHSFGGRVAIKLAATSNCVDRIVLIDSAGMRPHRGLDYYAKVTLYKVKRLLKRNVRNMGSNDYRNSSEVMRHTLKNVVNEHLEACLSSIRVPTLILWGDKDGETPLYMARRLHRGITDSKLVVFEGGGHFSYLDYPLETVREIITFLNT